MNMDKIVSDLVEKRFKDFLCECIGEEFKDEYHAKGLMKDRIREILQEVIDQNESKIKALMIEVVEKSILQGGCTPEFNYSINFNLSSWDLKRKYEKLLEEEKHAQ